MICSETIFPTKKSDSSDSSLVKAYSSMANGLTAGSIELLFEGVFDDPKSDCAKGGSGDYSIAIMSLTV